MYYCWLWEGSQLKRKIYAGLALLAIFAIVLYPLWPLVLRQGVYYLSWGLLGLLGLFFLMAIFRVILFCITYFTTPPGLWLFPNLWEDVSFMDSFRPVWAWHEVSRLYYERMKQITNNTYRPRRRRKRRSLLPLEPPPTQPSQPLLVKLTQVRLQLARILRSRLVVCSSDTTRPHELKSSMTTSRWHLKVTLGDGVFGSCNSIVDLPCSVESNQSGFFFVRDFPRFIQACTMSILS